MTNEETEAWTDLVEQAARGVAAMFPGSEVADLKQAIWEDLLRLEKKGKLPDPGWKHAMSGLYFAGRRAAWKERKDHLTISPQYGYTVDDLKELLAYHWSKETWCNSYVPDDAKSELGPVGLELQSDLSRVWDLLEKPQQVLIFSAYGLNEKVDSVKLYRAVCRMCDLLNTYLPGQRVPAVGDRRVMTNGHSKWLIGQAAGDGD